MFVCALSYGTNPAKIIYWENKPKAEIGEELPNHSEIYVHFFSIYPVCEPFLYLLMLLIKTTLKLGKLWFIPKFWFTESTFVNFRLIIFPRISSIKCYDLGRSILRGCETNIYSQRELPKGKLNYGRELGEERGSLEVTIIAGADTKLAGQDTL